MESENEEKKKGEWDIRKGEMIMKGRGARAKGSKRFLKALEKRYDSSVLDPKLLIRDLDPENENQEF